MYVCVCMVQSTFLQSLRLSIKETNQDVVPQAMGSPPAKPRNFLMLFPNKALTWGKKRIVEQ